MVSQSDDSVISEKVQKILQDGCQHLLQQQQVDTDKNEDDSNCIWLPPLRASKRSHQIRSLLKSDVLTPYKNNNTSDVSLIHGKYNHDLHSHLISRLEWDTNHEEWKLPFGSNFKRPHLVFYSPPRVTDGKSQFLIVHIGACRRVTDINSGALYLYPVPLQFDLKQDEKVMFSNKMRIVRCAHLRHFHERAAADLSDLCRLLCHYGRQVNSSVYYQSVAFAYSKDEGSGGQYYLSLEPIFGESQEYAESATKGKPKILYI